MCRKCHSTGKPIAAVGFSENPIRHKAVPEVSQRYWFASSAVLKRNQKSRCSSRKFLVCSWKYTSETVHTTSVKNSKSRCRPCVPLFSLG